MEPVKTPKQRLGEEEANHEQELEHIKGHTHSRCLKWEAWRSSLRSKDKESHQCCQAIGREVRIVHHHETLYHYHHNKFRWFAQAFHHGSPSAVKRVTTDATAIALPLAIINANV